MSQIMHKVEHHHPAHPLKQVFIKTEKGCKGQIIDDILYICSKNGCTVFHTVDNKEQTCSETLDYYEAQLADYNFVRIHNNTLMNMDFFKEYHKGRGGDVELLNGEILIVSPNGKVRLDIITKGKNHPH